MAVAQGVVEQIADRGPQPARIALDVLVGHVDGQAPPRSSDGARMRGDGGLDEVGRRTTVHRVSR
ncbi:hypothetical protein ACYF6T_19090 [Streptomyces sp. 7R007]